MSPAGPSKRAERLSRRLILRGTLALAGLGLASCAAPAAPPAPTAAATKPAALVAPASPAPSPSPAASPAAAAGAPAKLATIRAAWVAKTANQMLWPLAKEAGYFDKYGVSFELSYVNGSSTAIPALLARDLDTASTAASAVVGAQAAGQDIVMVAGFLNQAVFRVLAAKDVPGIEDVKGKTIAVTRIGNADYFAWQSIMGLYGWKQDDLTFVSADSVEGQVALLNSGAVQAIAVSPPNNVLAEQIGAHEVLDTAKLNIPEQNVGIIVTRRYMDENRAAMLNVIKASIEAVARWRSDLAFTKDVIKQYLQTTDQRFIDVGYEAYAPVWPEVPYPSREGVAKVIEQVSAQNPKAKDLSPDQIVDGSLVKELEDSGFIRQVFGR
ncbi:MAG TPA: ABC transporter substrate-binding protein [Chloroflexota bacterium]|nr:ABC transporter substrate-binding protein [Chloroflexota bacterium]